MAKFIFNDFVSDFIPNCPLSNSNYACQAIFSVLQKKGEVQAVKFVGLIYEQRFLFEWNIYVKLEDIPQPMLVRLPFFIPSDSIQAGEIMAKHQKALQSQDTLTRDFEIGDYLLIDDRYPCQLVSDDKGTLYIKRIEYFASQKMVQDFLSEVLNCELVTAAMVIINFHSLCCKDMHDIGWLISMDGVLSCVSLDRRFTNLGFFIIDGYDEISIGSKFNLNGQDYIVAEDADIGQFIAKIPSRR